MAVTRIRYDERHFATAEQCLSEISNRLEHGWTLSGIANWHGRFRAVFAWAEEHPKDDRQSPPSPSGGAQ